MSLYSIMPWFAAAAFGIATLVILSRVGERPRPNGWMLPALLSVLFAAWSGHAVVSEGPLGFWDDHTRSAWGNQIWFDLLMAMGTAWLLIVPEARRRGMRLLPWLAFVAATGSIGMMAMLSRLLYLRARDGTA